MLAIIIKHCIPAQPLLLGMITGNIKSDVVSKYISCAQFRAGKKAKSFGKLLDTFDTEEV